MLATAAVFVTAIWGPDAKFNGNDGSSSTIPTAIFVTVSIAAGEAFPTGVVALTSALAAGLGAGTAGGSVALAQSSDRALPPGAVR